MASAAADNGGLSAIPPNALAAGAGSRSNSGRTKAPAVVPCGHASGHLSTPSSGAGSVHGNGTTIVVNSQPVQTAVGSGQHPLAAAHAAEPVIPGSRENEMSSMIHAIELMNVVQADTAWQAAEQYGGSLNGGAAALLSALQSRGNESSVRKVQEDANHEEEPMDSSRARKKRAPSTSANPSANGVEAPDGDAAAAAAQHRHFAYPGASTSATFVRVAHRPQAHSLHDKVLNAEVGTIGAHAAGTDALGAALGRSTAALQHVEGAAHALPDAPLPGAALPPGVLHSMHAHAGAAGLKYEAAECHAPMGGGNIAAGHLWSGAGAGGMHAACACEQAGDGSTGPGSGDVIQRQVPALHLLLDYLNIEL